MKKTPLADERRVINFSGGKTSGLMTILEYRPGDIVIFTDTGREHPKTYKFLNDFEAHEKIPITRISYKDSSHAFLKLLQDREFKILPNKRRRICTAELKIETCKRYLRKIGVIRFTQMIGFRYDEQTRIKNHVERFKKVETIFPLNDRKITKPLVNEYWSHKPYNLEIPPILGNCTLCFMKGTNAITAILREFPDLAEPWINDEEQAAKLGNTNKKTVGGRTYFPGITIKQLRDYAQNNLFKDYPLDDVTPAFNCVCSP